MFTLLVSASPSNEFLCAAATDFSNNTSQFATDIAS
jgi:hypothetical protein